MVHLQTILLAHTCPLDVGSGFDQEGYGFGLSATGSHQGGCSFITRERVQRVRKNFRVVKVRRNDLQNRPFDEL